MGAADARRPERLSSARAGDRRGRPFARLLPRRPHTLGDPVEARGIARLGTPRAPVTEEIVDARPMHCVLAGDLDAVPESASVRFLRGLQSLGGLSVCYRDA